MVYDLCLQWMDIYYLCEFGIVGCGDKQDCRQQERGESKILWLGSEYLSYSP